MLLGPQLVDLSLHTSLTKKRKILDSSEVVWCAVHLYMPYTFLVMCEGKEERRSKKKKEEDKEEEEENRNFHV